jgi:hypothetical protein
MIRQSKGGEWIPRRIAKKEEAVFVKLGLLKAPQQQERKRGRPKGSRNRKS